MQHDIRRRWRGAARIAEAITIYDQQERALHLPINWFQEARELTMRHNAVVERGWLAAAESLHYPIGFRISCLQAELRLLTQRMQQMSLPLTTISAAEIYRDLVALEAEFPAVSFDFENSRLKVQTEEIVLEGLPLGAFQFSWNWTQLGTDRDLLVHALRPCRPYDRDDVTHPHISSDEFCVGEAAQPLECALGSGRLLDYFLILRQTLQTYNSESAFVEIPFWFQRRCQGCNDSLPRDDESFCSACQEILCSECLQHCSNCDDEACSSCLDYCPVCDRGFCPFCRPAGGLTKEQPCESCQETPERTSRPNEQSATATTDAPLQSVCLGEVDLPA